MSKLQTLGVSKEVLDWICSFISNRMQWVKINNFVSNAINVSSRVLQGSHCGPIILFTLYINDIKNIRSIPHVSDCGT